MKNAIATYIGKIRSSRKRTRRIVAALSILSLVVTSGVFWQLRIIGITKTAEPSCAMTEHIHDASCVQSRVLVCNLEEGQATPQLICKIPEHTHTESCYEEVQELVCTESDELHEHDESCYETRKILRCDLPEHVHSEACWSIPAEGHVHTDECYETVYSCGLEEHKHTVSCFSDINADLESEKDWVKTLPTDLSGVKRNDLVAIAKSQLGYTESERNYVIAEDGETLQHYSRYGEWYGNPYGNWNVMFASFCLYYAGIPQSEFPYASGGDTWIAELQNQGLFEYPDSYTPRVGDVVFVNLQSDGNENFAGIVTEVTDTSIETIEGDVNGQVQQASYELNDNRINGYGCNGAEDSQLPENLNNGQESPRIMTKEGSDYSVTVSFTGAAAIPETAELAVRELLQGSSEYDYYLQQTVSAMQLETAPAFCRFFDVSFVNEGIIIEPMAPVDVTITYAEALPIEQEEKCTAVHFAEEGLELLDTQVSETAEGDAVTFTQNSFSIVGTVIEDKLTLINNNKYVFYTGDGYALGVTYDAMTGYQVGAVPIKIANNGYITPADSSLTIDNISWSYSSIYGLYSPIAMRYLRFIASTPVVTPGTTAYTSTLGLANATASLSSIVINSSARLTSNYYNAPSTYTGSKDFMLAYLNGAFISGTEFNSAQTYLLVADVVEVSDELVDPGSLEVVDDIRDSGCIIPQLNITIPGTTPESTYTYVWEKSTDDGSTWNEVNRKKVTGNSYNLAADGSWLNIALDKGSEVQYRVSLVAVDGGTLATPIQSKTYYVPYFDELKNGDFEEPVVPLTSNAADYQPFLSNGTSGMVWKTTASDGQIEYISVAQPIYQDFSQRWHACEDAESGEQYVELNATQEGALYQDVLTVPGSTMYWQLSHRARGTSYMSGQSDTMYVVIMSTEAAENNDITTMEKVNQVISNPAAYPGARVVTIQNNNLQWYTENGSYDVPEEQYLSRYFFVAGNTASRDPSVGNHLDNVSFSMNLPAPDPDKTNVKVTKTIEGLSYDEAYELFNTMEFLIRDSSNGTLIREIGVDDFGLLEDNADGTYTASYTEQGLTPGRYVVYENTNGGIADLAGYTRTTSVTSANGTGPSSNTGGYYSLEVNSPANGTSSVDFRNSYERELVSVTLLKTGSDGTQLSAQFELAVKEGATWTVLNENVETVNGEAVLSSLSYDTLYRLTETKAPDGYVGNTQPFYFMVTADGLNFYDVSGTSIVQPDNVTASENPTSGKTITVVNQKGFVLPNTGGTGSSIFIITGLLLLAGSIMLECVLRRKRERRVST